MGFPPFDGPVNRFGLDIEGTMVRDLIDVSGLKLEQDAIEQKDQLPDGTFVVRKLPGRPIGGRLLVTRALGKDRTFEEWILAFRRGDLQAGSSIAVIAYDAEGYELRRYTLTYPWPVALEVGAMRAGGEDVVAEKLTISFDDLQTA